MFILGRLLTHIQPKPVSTYLDYTEDKFSGIVWRWGYEEGTPDHLACFCPNCDMQIYYNIIHGNMMHGEPNATSYECDHCKEFKRIIDIEPSDIKGSIIRQIERKLRTKEWREVVKEQREQ